MQKRFLEAGQIVSTHGLTGEVRVAPWCDSPDFLLQFNRFYLEEENRSLICTSSRAQKNVVLMKFEGVDSIDAARSLMRAVLFIDRGWVRLPPGSYFEQDLIGLSVEDAGSGRVYGRLSEVLRTGKNDVYAVKGPDGRETLIPAIRDVVRSVDLDAGKMTITPLKGLFDDED